MKIYISGPMTGLRDLNLPAFEKARDRLLAQGHCVVSPADLAQNEPQDSYVDYLRLDIKHLITCNTIYMLIGWEQSIGAKLELHIAQHLGFAVIYE